MTNLESSSPPKPMNSSASLVVKHTSYQKCLVNTSLFRQLYNIARVHPNLIPIGAIMVHFSTYARPCVHPMTCASQMGEACAHCVIKKLLQRDNTIKMYIYRSLSKFNKTFRLNRCEKPLSPFFLYRECCN